MTNKLRDVNAGDELIIHDVWGAINYKGPGLFIAGGAGVTPFIAILRQEYKDGKTGGSKLLFANKTVEDIILRDEFEKMLGGNFMTIADKSDDPKVMQGHIDKALLEKYVNADMQYYYVCGPDQFTIDMVEDLKKLGVAETHIITEQ
jgi:hypothetical protein